MVDCCGICMQMEHLFFLCVSTFICCGRCIMGHILGQEKILES